MSDKAWKAFCEFAKNPRSEYQLQEHLEERWDVVLVAPKRKPKKLTRGPRKPTIAKAMRQATKAGVTPTGATINPDGGVTLEFETGTAAKTNGHAIETAEQLRRLI